VSLPKPEPGRVIRYSYLWRREHRSGQEEGIKDRPCAIVLSAKTKSGVTIVVVLPITHRQPDEGQEALELPPAIKKLLRLDARRSWVILTESNEFDWPGPDLRRARRGDDSSISFGMLPPRFFEEITKRFLRLEDADRSARVRRTQ
jgi:hypothetical protein